MKWNTRVTDLLGCKYPILEGALTGLGDKNAEFAAHVSRTGAVGCITAHSYRSAEALRAAIALHREMTPNPFMVNFSIGICKEIDTLLEAAIEEKVPVIETSAYRPDDWAERIKASGAVWIHKAATVDAVRHAEKLGADAVVLVGLDGYGFKSVRQLPTFTAIAWASRQLKVPLIAAGGVADGRTMLGALMAGAEAVYIGSLFMAATECPIARKIKENMIAARPDHPGLIWELVAPPDPVAYDNVMSKRGDMPLGQWLMGLEAVMLKHHQRQAPASGELDEKQVIGELARKAAGDRPRGPFSFACGYVDREMPIAEMVETMVKDAEQLLREKVGRWGFVPDGA